MEKKYLLSKDGVRRIYGGDAQVPEKFINNTAITNAVAVPVEDLVNIQKKHGLYKLENIEVEENTTGNVRCDGQFRALQESRKANSLSSRIKKSGEWKQELWILLALGIVAIVLHIFLFTPMADKQAALNKQINTASELAKSGEWKISRYIEAERPGPLKINLRDWEEATKAQLLHDSLQKKIESIKTTTDSLITKMTGSQKLATAPYNQLTYKVRDSVMVAMNKLAQEILTDASKVLKENSGKEGANSYLLQDFEKAKKRATAILQSRDSVISALQLPIKNTIKKIETDYKNQIDSIKNTSANAVKAIEKSMPTVKPYEYDLLNPDQYTKSYGASFAWISKWGGIACLVIFIGFLVYMFTQLPKRNHSENQRYTHTNLRIMAFPGFVSSTNGNNRCSLSFYNVSGKTIENLVSVRMRYTWNALCHPNSFEFTGKLEEHEKLTLEEKNNAFQPIFYAIEGNVAIIYSGLDKQATEEDSNPVKEVVL